MVLVPSVSVAEYLTISPACTSSSETPLTLNSVAAPAALAPTVPFWAGRMVIVPLSRSMIVIVPVPVVACWAHPAEPISVSAAQLANTIFAIFMEASERWRVGDKPRQPDLFPPTIAGACRSVLQANACPAFEAGRRPVRDKQTPQIRNLQPRFDAIETEKPLTAPHDVDGSLFAVAPGNRDALLGAARHIRPVGTRDHRRKAMRPIPGNVIGVGGMRIAGWRHGIYQGLITRWPVIVSVHARPEDRAVVSPVMAERPVCRRMEISMRRSERSTLRCYRAGERLVRGQHERYGTERRDQRPIHFTRHGTHQLVGY